MSGGSPDVKEFSTGSVDVMYLSHPVFMVDLVILSFGSVSRLGVCRLVSRPLAPFGAKVSDLFDNRCPAPKFGAPTRSGP